MKKHNIIKIILKNGHSAIWEAKKDEWDDYAYDGKVFIIKKNNDWIGFYNMDNVISIIVK